MAPPYQVAGPTDPHRRPLQTGTHRTVEINTAGQRWRIAFHSSRLLTHPHLFLRSLPTCKKMAAKEDAQCSLAVELFDECWFFRNPFSSAPNVSPQSSSREPSAAEGASSTDSVGEGPATPQRLPGKEKPAAPTAATAVSSRLLRAPSLPSRAESRHRAGRRPLRHSCSNLESILRSPPFASSYRLSSESVPLRQRPPQDARVLESIVKYVRSHHRAITAENCRWPSIGGKKWRSLSDLETEEIQGFRDLGFVFDKEAINPSAMETIPGVGPPAEGNKEEETIPAAGLPDHSEVQIAGKSAPQPSLDWLGGSSPADKKLHLRLWAQVVASSVRQEC